MSPEGRNESSDLERPTRSVAPAPVRWGLALDLGMRLGVSILLGVGLGLLLDNWLGMTPLFTLVGVLLGIAAAMYTIWDVARDAMRR